MDGFQRPFVVMEKKFGELNEQYISIQMASKKSKRPKQYLGVIEKRKMECEAIRKQRDNIQKLWFNTADALTEKLNTELSDKDREEIKPWIQPFFLQCITPFFQQGRMSHEPLWTLLQLHLQLARANGVLPVHNGSALMYQWFETAPATLEYAIMGSIYSFQPHMVIPDFSDSHCMAPEEEAFHQDILVLPISSDNDLERYLESTRRLQKKYLSTLSGAADMETTKLYPVLIAKTLVSHLFSLFHRGQLTVDDISRLQTTVKDFLKPLYAVIDTHNKKLANTDSDSRMTYDTPKMYQDLLNLLNLAGDVLIARDSLVNSDYLLSKKHALLLWQPYLQKQLKNERLYVFLARLASTDLPNIGLPEIQIPIEQEDRSAYYSLVQYIGSHAMAALDQGMSDLPHHSLPDPEDIPTQLLEDNHLQRVPAAADGHCLLTSIQTSTGTSVSQLRTSLKAEVGRFLEQAALSGADDPAVAARCADAECVLHNLDRASTDQPQMNPDNWHTDLLFPFLANLMGQPLLVILPRNNNPRIVAEVYQPNHEPFQVLSAPELRQFLAEHPLGTSSGESVGILHLGLHFDALQPVLPSIRHRANINGTDTPAVLPAEVLKLIAPCAPVIEALD